jgi:hypothetical protein
MGAEPGTRENANLVFLERSRKLLKDGDVFTFRLLEGPYRFGRVMRASIEGHLPIPGCHLLYVYDVSAVEPEAPPAAALTPERLLIPPLYANRQGWLRGYFKTVARRPVEPDDLLKEHCFRWGGLKPYVNERGESLPGPVEPCGVWGVASHRGLDDKVSAALGLPLAPD